MNTLVSNSFMERKYKILLLVILTIVVLVAVRLVHRETTERPSALSTEVSSDTDVLKSTVSPEEIVESGVPQDAIPSLDKPTFIPTDQALKELGASGMGLAVVKGSLARFYPFQILTWHEVVNDTVAGTPMAITYCALCNVGVVYESTLQNSPLSFGVSGKLHNLDSLLYDRTTNSLWSQVTGEAVSGKMSGQKLHQVPALALTLKEFTAQYPSGEVLSKFTGFVRNYDDLSYGDIAGASNGATIIAQKNLWHPKTKIVGVEVSGKFKAYPEELVEQKTIVDSFAGVKLQIGIGDGKVVVANITNSQDKTYIPSISMYWFMWQLWHADTQIYKK